MRRDMDLIRRILLAVEDGAIPEYVEATGIATATQRDVIEVAAHIDLLADAGMVVSTHLDEMGPGKPERWIHRMTMDGHDFLDAIRSEGAMERIHSAAESVGGGITIAVARDLAVAWLKEQVGIGG